jgi:DNA replication protein DnaC
MHGYTVDGKMPDAVVSVTANSGIPTRFERAVLSTGQCNKRFVLPLQNYLKIEPEYTENVILVGDSGTGKTHAASAFLNEIVRITMYERPMQVRYVNLNTNLQDILDAKYFRNEEKYHFLLTKTLQADILVMDDLLQLPGTPGAKDLVMRIYETRYAAQLSTVTTLNLKTTEDQGIPDLDILVQVYDEPFVRRLFNSAKKYTLKA